MPTDFYHSNDKYYFEFDYQTWSVYPDGIIRAEINFSNLLKELYSDVPLITNSFKGVKYIKPNKSKKSRSKK